MGEGLPCCPQSRWDKGQPKVGETAQPLSWGILGPLRATGVPVPPEASFLPAPERKARSPAPQGHRRETSPERRFVSTASRFELVESRFSAPQSCRLRLSATGTAYPGPAGPRKRRRRGPLTSHRALLFLIPSNHKQPPFHFWQGRENRNKLLKF